jgi:hypothetical protein
MTNPLISTNPDQQQRILQRAIWSQLSQLMVEDPPKKPKVWGLARLQSAHSKARKWKHILDDHPWIKLGPHSPAHSRRLMRVFHRGLFYHHQLVHKASIAEKMNKMQLKAEEMRMIGRLKQAEKLTRDLDEIVNGRERSTRDEEKPTVQQQASVLEKLSSCFKDQQKSAKEYQEAVHSNLEEQYDHNRRQLEAAELQIAQNRRKPGANHDLARKLASKRLYEKICLNIRPCSMVASFPDAAPPSALTSWPTQLPTESFTTK